MKNISKKIIYLILFFSLISLIYIFYRSEFHYGYSQFNYYFKYYFVIGIFIILTTVVTFLNNNFQKKYLLSLFSILFSIYLLEGLINLFNINKKNIYEINQKILKERILIADKQGINYDTRSKLEYYNYKKKEDENIAIAIGTNTYLKKSEINKNFLKDIFPLSGLSTRFCAEFFIQHRSLPVNTTAWQSKVDSLQ